jgi:hypothetical protein
MRQITITRQGAQVVFADVSLDNTESVFFTNLDPQQAHWPDFIANQLGASPSPNSDDSAVPTPPNNPSPPYDVTYKCKLHAGESGVIHVFNPLAAAATTAFTGGVAGRPFAPQPVVVGGKSPYTISGQVFQILNSSGQVVLSGQGSIGPGLQLLPQGNNGGIEFGGTPTRAGTYQFAFVVNDAMGRNLQQVQYSLQVSPAAAPPIV